MSFEQILHELNSVNWPNVVPTIHKILKPELQTMKGFIRAIKNQREDERKDSIHHNLNYFHNTGVENLDGRINTCIKEIERINSYYNISLQYELIDVILRSKVTNRYPNVLIVKSFLKGQSITSQGYNRLSAILYQIGNQSISQGNKSNAGMAGEGMVRAIFNAVGLEKGIHFSEQHKSKKGSDTDFVLPCVANFDESNIVMLVAAQLSTNDRGRLAQSELKQGGVRFLVTGNGLDSSTKRLSDIGTQILQSFESDNIRVACFEDEIIFEKNRVRKIINESSSSTDNEYTERLKYLESHVISFAHFAMRIEQFKIISRP